MSTMHWRRLSAANVSSFSTLAVKTIQAATRRAYLESFHMEMPLEEAYCWPASRAQSMAICVNHPLPRADLPQRAASNSAAAWTDSQSMRERMDNISQTVQWDLKRRARFPRPRENVCLEVIGEGPHPGRS